MAVIRIGTRGSKLALWQAEWVSSQLVQRGHDVELIAIATQGDVSTASLSQVGGQGVFTKEIQRELLSGAVDLAVHSLKDLPTQKIPGLTLAAIPERESTKDCLISPRRQTFEALPAGARIGTGSARRGAQLLAWRSDVEILDIRGNVDSRIRKLEEGKFDAIILAAAGLIRLNLAGHVSEYLPQEKILPAIGQGALGLECRQDDAETIEAVRPLNHAASQACVMAERSLLSSLLAGCLAPVAALGELLSDNRLRLQAGVFSVDGKQAISAVREGHPNDAEKIGAELASQLVEQGASALIAAARR